MQFRQDINGLRAIAVIAVVLFHFNASWMPGGFAGVDVFFVISGFLMTGIIFRAIEQENFSILKFYIARANRIIPALAALCFVLLVFGWFYLTPLDYRVLGKHVGSSISFLSNIIYWRESGYFDAASHEKWLLHTWSLSAEWQFYMIYPVLLVVMRKFLSLDTMKTSVLIGTLLGFIFCVIATYKWPDPSYYLLPARAWEMMIGGVAYLYPLKLNEQKKKALEWTGLMLIIGSYLLISKDNLWPGYWALIPVMGAFFIIQAQRNNSMITGNVIFQQLGKWSYSIYLWHWPLVVFIFYFQLDSSFIYYGVIASFIAGMISYHLIETIRFKPIASINAINILKTKSILLTVLIGLMGSVTFIYGYKHTSVAEPVKLRGQLTKEAHTQRVVEVRAGICHFSATGKYNKLEDFVKHWDCRSDNEGLIDSRMLVFGDSHSADKAMGLRLNGIDVIQIGGSACSFSPEMAEQRNEFCPTLFHILDTKVSSKDYDYVLLANRFERGDLDNPIYLQSTLDYWSKKEQEVILFSPMPDLQLQFNEYLRFGTITRQPILSKHDKFFNLLKDMEVPSNIHIINTYDIWCHKEAPCKVADGDKVLMTDGGHLSPLGSTHFVKWLLKDPTFSQVVKINKN